MNSFEDSWNRNKSDETWFNKDVAERIFNEQQKKIDELQKRIDDTNQFCSDYGHDLNIGMLKMKQLLGGEK